MFFCITYEQRDCGSKNTVNNAVFDNFIDVVVSSTISLLWSVWRVPKVSVSKMQVTPLVRISSITQARLKKTLVVKNS